MSNSQTVYVAGTGMTPFCKPGSSPAYDVMGAEAINAALDDSGLSYGEIEQAYAGYVYGDSTAGQRVLYRVGLSGIPIINVNNNCATGSTALVLARQAIASGLIDCALAVGFEQMRPGALAALWDDRPGPLDDFLAIAERRFGTESNSVPMALRLFGGAAEEYRDRYGCGDELFPAIRAKASQHAVNNPNAVFRTPVTREEVLASPSVFRSTRRLECCPPTSGAAAVVLCSDGFRQRRGLDCSVRVLAQSMVTDTEATFHGDSMINAVGADLSRRAAKECYEAAGLGPEAVDVVELHDCFAVNEALSYEALGLCPEGEALAFVRDGQNTYGGQCVSNPSGGLLSKGHPLGATGLAQIHELNLQLQGRADKRQVPDARVALQHNIGLGGAAVVTLLANS